MDKMLPDEQIHLTFDRGTLVLTNASRDELASGGDGRMWQWDGRVGAWRCDAIHYATVRKTLVEEFKSRVEEQLNGLNLTPALRTILPFSHQHMVTHGAPSK